MGEVRWIESQVERGYERVFAEYMYAVRVGLAPDEIETRRVRWQG